MNELDNIRIIPPKDHVPLEKYANIPPGFFSQTTETFKPVSKVKTKSFKECLNEVLNYPNFDDISVENASIDDDGNVSMIMNGNLYVFTEENTPATIKNILNSEKEGSGLDADNLDGLNIGIKDIEIGCDDPQLDLFTESNYQEESIEKLHDMEKLQETYNEYIKPKVETEENDQEKYDRTMKSLLLGNPFSD